MKNQTTFSFDIDIKKSQEKSFIKVPLEIPEGVEKVTISYDYDGAHLTSAPIGQKNVIDLAILSPEGGDIGATGSDYKTVWFGESESSPGYKHVKLIKATWFILVGAYMVKEEGVRITYTVTFDFKHERWLRGDPHIHTINSDGVYDYVGIAKLAKRKGADFIIITDHNNTIEGSIPRAKGLTIIDGVEWTHYNGHYNFLGVAKPYSKSYAVNSFEEFLELNSEAKGKGAIGVINHPTSSCPWKYPTDFEYDGIEVYNGPIINDNLKAVELWDKELKKGKKVFATAGSDFHKFSFTFGISAIAVFSKSSSKEDIIEGIREGKIVVLSSLKAPILVIKSQDVVASGQVKLEKDSKISLSCDRVKKGWEIVVISKSGTIYQQKITKSGAFSIELEIKETGYVRAELRKKTSPKQKLIDYIFNKILYPSVKPTIAKYTIEALTNPVYFED